MTKPQTFIELRNVGVDFPVLNASNLSFKNAFLRTATGGAIDRKYDGSVVVRGLQNVNLAIRAGERVGLVGHNGAGKTTLLRILSGIYTPTEGEAIIHGECVSLINISLGIDPEATGRENIKLRSAMIGLSPLETKSKMAEIIEFSGLGDFIDMPFRTYSSGMQLRLAFAVSTVINPQILILDEWLSTGDRNFRERAEKRMRQIVDDTEILILASHVPAFLKENCDRVIWLEHGQVRMDGKVDEVVDAYFGGEMEKLKRQNSPNSESVEKGLLPPPEATKKLSLVPHEVIFEEGKQPGDNVVKLQACRIRNANNEVVYDVFSSEEFFVDIEYRVLQSGFYLRAGCVVSDALGDCIFWTADPHSDLVERPAEPGYYRASVLIPGSFMAPGLVRFYAAVGDARTGARVNASAADLLPLVIKDDLHDLRVRGSYQGQLPGVVRPRLEWKTDPIGRSENL